MKTKEEIEEDIRELEGSENQAYNKDFIEGFIAGLRSVLES